MKFEIKARLFIGNSRIDLKNYPSFRPRPLVEWIINTNDFELNMYGSLWGESLVLDLGNHLSVYRQKSSLWWALNQTVSPINPSYAPQTGKTAGSSVTGNFGEVLTILALESLVPYPEFLGICHITSKYGKRSPDIFVETTPLIDVHNKKFKNKKKTSPSRSNWPSSIPGECKNSDFLEALRQLAVYWFYSQSSDDFGYGLISTINYEESNEIMVNLNLIIPKDIPKLRGILISEKDAKGLKQKDLKDVMYGFEKRRRNGKSL
ncbi:hypothetical protein [Solibacillus sp. CAU 1738]|uniref:hypothetical protein n=1 Tax=Solibacillus sp. CAU 1738 TaxID=3140363 RepID=UPI003261CB83